MSHERSWDAFGVLRRGILPGRLRQAVSCDGVSGPRASLLYPSLQLDIAGCSRRLSDDEQAHMHVESVLRAVAALPETDTGG